MPLPPLFGNNRIDPTAHAEELSKALGPALEKVGLGSAMKFLTPAIGLLTLLMYAPQIIGGAKWLFGWVKEHLMPDRLNKGDHPLDKPLDTHTPSGDPIGDLTRKVEQLTETLGKLQGKISKTKFSGHPQAPHSPQFGQRRPQPVQPSATFRRPINPGGNLKI